MESGKTHIWSRVQPRGGTQIPKEIQQLLDLKAGDVLLWYTKYEGSVTVMKGEIQQVTQKWPHKTSQ